MGADLTIGPGRAYGRAELAAWGTDEARQRVGEWGDGVAAVPFDALLGDSPPPPDATHVTFEATDGYAVSIPVTKAAADAILLVPRPEDPRTGVRLLVLEARSACYNVKAVTSISFSAGPGRHTVDPEPHRNPSVPGWD